jgi:hypothetical protein
MLNNADYAFRYFKKDFPTEFLYWMGYIFIPIITATLLGCSSFIHEIFQSQSIFGFFSGTPMVDQFLICFKTWKAMGNWYLTINRIITTAGENELVLWRQKPRPLTFHWFTLNPKDKSIIPGYDLRL